jgi:hypothetical protein
VFGLGFHDDVLKFLNIKEHSLQLKASNESDSPETTEIAFKALNTRKVRRDSRLILANGK